MTNLFPIDHPGRSPLWDEVMTRAGDRCEQTTLKRRQMTRCEHEAPGVALVVAPRDPGLSEAAGSRVARTELAAWCLPCLAAARHQADARRRRPRLGAGQGDLLSLVPELESSSAMSVPSGTTDSVTSDCGGVAHSE